MRLYFSTLLILLVDVAFAFTGNFTVEQLYDERWGNASPVNGQFDSQAWNNADQAKKVGLTPSILKGRGMVQDIRLRTSGARNYNADGREAGIYIYLRQVVNGELGQWRQSVFLIPDDLALYPNTYLVYPGSTINYVGGIWYPKNYDLAVDPDSYDTTQGRDGMRLEYNKHAVTGNPETTNAVMLSVFGFTYTGEEANSYSATGAAYVFTGEYYHWTQVGRPRISCILFIFSSIKYQPLKFLPVCVVL